MESIKQTIERLEKERDELAERVYELSNTLKLVMNYPEIRKYLGDKISSVADKALKCKK